jgi:hypothetical protein
MGADQPLGRRRQFVQRIVRRVLTSTFLFWIGKLRRNDGTMWAAARLPRSTDPGAATFRFAAISANR